MDDSRKVPLGAFRRLTIYFICYRYEYHHNVVYSLDMEAGVKQRVTCVVCNRSFDDRKGLSYHVSHMHNLLFKDYVVKYEFNGVVPTCACGCGEEVSYFSGKFMTYRKTHIPKSVYNKSELTRFRISKAVKGKKQSAESNEKRSIATKAYHKAHPELAKLVSEHMTSKIMSQETRDKISVTRSKMIASGELTINSKKISETIASMYVDCSFNWTKGFHDSTKTGKRYVYRSSYELKYFKLLDNDQNVATYESEFTSIPYELDGKSRHYVPDVHVTYVDGSQCLVEIKPRSMRDIPMNVAKREAAIRYCDENGWKYAEWEPKEG